MRLLGFLLIALGLIAGLISAMTAYSPRLHGGLAGLELNADAGIARDESGASLTDKSGRPRPLAKKGEELTPELIEKLRASGERRVRVKEFALLRWDFAWLFLCACVLLGGGAVAVRAAARSAADGARLEAAAGETVRASVDRILSTLQSLRGELDTIPREDRNAHILSVVGTLQREPVAVITEARGAIIAERGMTGYARLMDAFAAAERQLNRAWSAAADEYEAESRACLAEASERFAHLRELV